jgi:hypothetical protein
LKTSIRNWSLLRSVKLMFLINPASQLKYIGPLINVRGKLPV